jgi:hypothetical protein
VNDRGLPADVGAVLAEALTDHPYDAEVAADLAARLYRALPDLYRIPDLPPRGRLELLRLLAVLAGPLATVRQSVQELHADLFIDTADDAMIPYLAQMVGTSLVFPDAASNRRDVRGTVGWRRRKGTPGALEEMGGELTGQAVVLQEGWKRVQLAQDLDLLRLERTTVDVRPAIVAEQADGPLDALAHAVDVRAVGARTGRSHPRHVAHWMFPTVTFPLAAGTPYDRTGPGTDLRFAFDPLGGRRGLRARRPTGDRRPFTDRIPDEHFAADPARWFDADGGFTVQVTGLAAAVALPPGAQLDRGTAPSPRLVARDLTRGSPTIELLDRPTRGWRGALRVELGLAAVASSGATWHATVEASFAQRAVLDLDASGVVASGTGSDPDPGGARVVVLRLSTTDGAGRFFPGATLALAGTGPAAGTAVADAGLAREGFLAGAVHVRVPPVQVASAWSALIGLDGGLYAVAGDTGPVEHPVQHGERRPAPSALLTTGPGVAWPGSPGRAEPVPVDSAPAPGRGPAVLHGARVVRRTGNGYADIAAGAACALSFALRLDRPNGPVFHPIQRLAWTGADPVGATWAALDDAGLPLAAADTQARISAIAELADAEAGHAVVVVRFESSVGQASCCPGEVAWTTDDGRTLLVHIPQLDAEPDAGGSWPADPAYTAASDLVRLAADGSTWASDSTALARLSLGDVAPLAAPTGLRRRRVHPRTLCAWDHEDPTASPPLVLAPTEPGRLDVDVSHGLFALSALDPPRPWPDGPVGGPPPPATVTVGYEEGATMHLGALPAAREPVLDRRLPRPTRLVCGGGVLHRDAPRDWHDIPRYPTLTAALDAVSAAWSALAGNLENQVQAEVVQVEDDATYAGETPTWPSGPTDATAAATCTLSLTLQAAERRRPTVLVDPATGWAGPANPVPYDRLVVTGLALGGAGWSGLEVPPTRAVRIELSSILFAENTLAFRAPDSGGTVTVNLCQTAGLRLDGPGELIVVDSIVDAAGAAVITVPTGSAELTRVSVGGMVTTRVLFADTVIFDGDVTVEDRFHGCVRYSRVTAGSVLPQAFKVGHDVPLRIVSRNRRDPAWWRLREDCDPAVSAGAEDGSELGAFGSVHLAARLTGFRSRLVEFTPVGLQTGLIRAD